VTAGSDDSPNPRKYWAFISYSHADRAWADWLHKALEQYRVPRRLVGVNTPAGPVPPRLAPIFLDRVDLAASFDLDATITGALRSSRSLIVICSPSATRSQRVADEIVSYREMKSGLVLPLIVAGRPDAAGRGGSAADECFPAPLRGPVVLGRRDISVPLAADARPGKGGRQEALLKLVAGILNLNLDRLRQRDTQRRRLRWGAATAVCLIGMLCASALALYAWNQRDAALQAQSRALTETAAELLDGGDVAAAQGVILSLLDNRRFARVNTPREINVFQEARAADAQIVAMAGHTGGVVSAAISPDGRRVVTASLDNTARVWDAEWGQELLLLKGHTSVLNGAAFSADGRRIITASSDQTARVWDATTGQQILLLRGHTDRVQKAAFSPDAKWIATASDDHTARIWDAATGQPIMTFSGHTGPVESAAFSPDSRYVVTASLDGTARIWDDVTGREITMLRGHKGWVSSAAFSPDSRRVVTSSFDKTARVWDSATGQQILLLNGHSGAVEFAAFSADGNRLVTASEDKTARIWDAVTGQQIMLLSGHADVLGSAAFSPDGERVVTASFDRTARVWDTTPNHQLMALTEHTGWVLSAAFSADGARIVTTSLDKTARVWDAATGRRLLLLIAHTDRVTCARFSPDGRRIVTAANDGTARIWDAATGAQMTILGGHTDLVTSAVYSADGERILTASADKTARIWDATTGRQDLLLTGHTDRVTSAAFSPDAKTIVTASFDKTARIWDVATGRQIISLIGHTDRVSSAAFSPDGNHIVTTSFDKTARIWDARAGREILALNGHTGWVLSGAFSPDGRRIVTASGDNTVRLWDAVTGLQLMLLKGHTDRVQRAAFSPDGQLIVTASLDGSARVWSALTPELDTQIKWARAAEFDRLSSTERLQLGLPIPRGVRHWPPDKSACDDSAAAPYDPDRHASGVMQDHIIADIALAACEKNDAGVARLRFQHGRALMAHGDFPMARREFEAAITAGARAARIDLAALLSQPSAGMLDVRKAVSLYEQAWSEGVTAAAFQLGYLYEHGVNLTEKSPARAALAPDEGEAWRWYQRGASAAEPNSLARVAARHIDAALSEPDAGKKRAQLLEAFRNYAAAAHGCSEEPDDPCRNWQYRRATLARRLAREGMMQQIADAYVDE
jgi:WD40 repeat protein/TPR repeat protein